MGGERRLVENREILSVWGWLGVNYCRGGGGGGGGGGETLNWFNAGVGCQNVSCGMYIPTLASDYCIHNAANTAYVTNPVS